MAPGEVAGVPDQDQRHAVEAGAGDVDLAGDLQVGLEEALGPVPGEVRVAEHHSLAGPRRLPAEPVGVGADVDAQALFELAQLPGVGTAGAADWAPPSTGVGGSAAAMPSIATPWLASSPSW